MNPCAEPCAVALCNPVARTNLAQGDPLETSIVQGCAPGTTSRDIPLCGGCAGVFMIGFSIEYSNIVISINIGSSCINSNTSISSITSISTSININTSICISTGIRISINSSKRCFSQLAN